MAFIQFKLEKSVNQSRGIFDKYVYDPDNGDTSEDVLSLGYFDKSRFSDDQDWNGSIIEAKLDDGYFLFQISDGNALLIANPEKAYIFVRSSSTFQISSDSNDTTIFNSGLELETDSTGWQIEASLGGVRNVSGRSLIANEGIVSAHTENSNASSSELYIYSEISIDNGATWVKNEQSGREQTVAGTSQEYGSKSSQAFNVPNNAIVRFRAYASTNNVSFTPVSFTADGETVNGPSFRWRLSEV